MQISVDSQLSPWMPSYRAGSWKLINLISSEFGAEFSIRIPLELANGFPSRIPSELAKLTEFGVKKQCFERSTNDFLYFKFHEKLERIPSLRIPSKLLMLMIYPGTYQFPSDQNSTEFSLPKIESSCFTSQIQIIWIFKSTKINQRTTNPI